MTDRLRLALAPSTLLHLAEARIAVVEWLVARSTGGSLVLRIEDLERSAMSPEYEAALLEDLRWLGIDWDEGPGPGGAHGPYRQSERGTRYERALLALRRAGVVYACFCTPGVSEHASAQTAPGDCSACTCTCRDLTEDQASRRTLAGELPAWRYAVPADATIAWVDQVRGRASVATRELADFVVTAADGRVARALASVADDAAMGVTLVLRDDDRMLDTARELLLYGALGLHPPAFAHLPPMTDPAGTTLPDGGDSIRAVREAGFLPDALVEHLARLGWSDPLDRLALSRDELVAAFDLRRVLPTPPAHDPQAMRALNVRHLRALSTEELLAALLEHVPPLPDWLDGEAFAEAVRLEIEVLGDAYPHAAGLITAEPADDEAAFVLSQPDAAPALEAALAAAAETRPFEGAATLTALEERLADIDRPHALQAVRVALTGRPDGLPLHTIFALLGKEEATARLTRARARAAIDTSEGGNG